MIIGDSLKDARTGLEVGARVIGVASGRTTTAELTRAGADLVLDSLVDVARVPNVICELNTTGG